MHDELDAKLHIVEEWQQIRKCTTKRKPHISNYNYYEKYL